MSNRQIIGYIILLALMVMNIADSVINVSKPGFVSTYLGIGRRGRIIAVLVNIILLVVFCWLTFFY